MLTNFRSGSMSGDPIKLVKETLHFMVQQLGDEDQFGIVSFGSDSTVELHLTYMNNGGKTRAKSVIDKITISGCTNLSDGLFDGIKLINGSNNLDNIKSVLLLTDGQPTGGVMEPNELGKQCAEKLAPISTKFGKKCSIFTFGYGSYHDENFLRQVSDRGGGMYYYIPDTTMVKQSFADCLGGLLSTVACDVSLRFDADKGVKINKVHGQYNITPISTTITSIQLGDLYAEEKRNVLFSVDIPSIKTPEGEFPLGKVSLVYKTLDNEKQTTTCIVKIPRVHENEIDKDLDVSASMEIDEQRNRINVADALDRASNFINRGNTTEAQRILNQALDALEVSISMSTHFTQNLVLDLKEAISNITGQPRDHASKYMYGLARSLYAQRSSGIASASAEAFITSSKRSMVSAAGGNSRVVVATNVGGSGSVAGVGSSSISTAASDNGLGPLVRKPVSAEKKSRALRRMALDLKEIELHPLPTVVARPLDADIFEWHCDIIAPPSSPYKGIVFHLILQFPHDYPFSPPTLFFCSFIKHPHVFGSWVCLDMLRENFAEDELNQPYTGWSTAYSVHSILLQLQAFLFDEANNDKNSIEKARLSAKRFECKVCGHKHEAPWPPIDPTKVEAQLTASTSTSSNNTSPSTTTTTTTTTKTTTSAPTTAQKSSVSAVSSDDIQSLITKLQTKLDQVNASIVQSFADVKDKKGLLVERSLLIGDLVKLRSTPQGKLLPSSLDLQSTTAVATTSSLSTVDSNRNVGSIATASSIQKAAKDLLLSSGDSDESESNLSFITFPQLNDTTGPFGYLSEDITLYIFSFLSADMVNRLSSVCKEFLHLSGDKLLWRKLFSQRYKVAFNNCKRFFNIQDWKATFSHEIIIARVGIRCFHSKVSYRDDILGIPVSVSFKAKFHEFSSSLDYLSYESFHKDHVKTTVWGEQFSHWLPVWINEEHGNRAFPYIEKAIHQLACVDGPPEPYNPKMALTVISRFMCTLVVSVMSGTLHASIKALEGYCIFHRLLLVFVKRYPELQEYINRQVRAFCVDAKYRTKDVIPNLGEFIAYFSVADIPWGKFRMPYLLENFDRNALWAIKQYPHLASVPSSTVTSPDWGRLNETFEANNVSLKLLCFHVYFIRNIARPMGISKEEIASNYDMFYGQPSTEMKENLQKHIFQVRQIKSWPEFFKYVGMTSPSPAHLTDILIQAVKNSEAKGYHGSSGGRGGRGGRGGGRGGSSGRRY
eukprot:TRINITY_DN698_c1_g3_i2.p1 TRINITY_DN698_c1_g3~~TRINITY_DN698_c1_g3_i2.p1  ORF type:complete len:1226 (-),score=381.44 TRINITY_DN698_c1_g3_i2:32-3709(-)